MRRESPGSTRRKVLWLGSAPERGIADEFGNRGLVIQESTEEKVLRELPLATGIVFRFNKDQPDVLVGQVNNLANQAVDHGLIPVMLANNDEAFLSMDVASKALSLEFEVTKKVMSPNHVIAELMARHDPGPGETDVEVKGERVPDLTRLFLRRAFYDCKAISIGSLTEGYSAEVYSVHALFKDSRVGPRPLPFFAKVDSRDKILTEWYNYQDLVGHFIPFQARPNLDPNRCFLGASHGILVGNFVEQSESLWSAAKRSAAQPVIYSLFDHALRGWRLQAYVLDDAQAFSTGLFTSLQHLIDPKKPIMRKRTADATAFGKVRSLEDICNILKAKDAIRHRVAPQHGDLHVNNVRACRGEAILIDFQSARHSGPLVADPASLEVSIVFEVDPDDKDNEGWLALAETLYRPEYLQRAPPPPKEPAPREWMWACVRQIRLIALDSQTSENEYQIALIVHLLRRASFQDDSGPDKYRRDYAFYLASQLADRLATGT